MVRWNLQRDLSLYAPRFNIAPSQQVPVILSADGAPDAKGMQWGLVPWWAKDQAIGNRMINARAETLTEKGAFKNLVETALKRGRVTPSRKSSSVLCTVST
jgi:putative SOS response-associated peptidase YedK